MELLIILKTVQFGMDLAAMILKRCLVFRQSNRRTREFTGLTSDKFVFYSIIAFPNKSFLWFKYRDKPPVLVITITSLMPSQKLGIFYPAVLWIIVKSFSSFCLMLRLCKQIMINKNLYRSCRSSFLFGFGKTKNWLKLMLLLSKWYKICLFILIH